MQLKYGTIFSLSMCVPADELHAFDKSIEADLLALQECLMKLNASTNRMGAVEY